jgi:hypothetical protein
MQVQITITDTAGSAGRQVSVSGPTGDVPVEPSMEQIATPLGSGAEAGINAGAAPVMLSKISIAPTGEDLVSQPGTGASAGINAGPAPARS